MLTRTRTCILVVATAIASLTTLASLSPAAAQLPDRWTYHADVDGDGEADRLTLEPSDDLHVHDQIGTGHYRLQVRFATGAEVGRRLWVDHYFSDRDGGWTPWFGSTQVDHVRGKEAVLGRTSGAHADFYVVVTYRHGRLRLLDTPTGRSEWGVSASVGTGSRGWRCTEDGVQSRSLKPNSDGSRYRITRVSYVLRIAWHQSGYVRRSVPATNGLPPSYAADYASFACPGLPQ
jgi:hypothetical protein